MGLFTPPLSLYIHIPWCVRKCPYCDFNSHAQYGALPQEAYVDALLADLDQDLSDFGEALIDRPLISIFFGGGTPSLFTPDAIARILDGVAKRLAFVSNIEVTLETNPGTVEHGRFDGYQRAGINRISFGIQSFNDDKLKRLGRIHSAAEAGYAVKSAQDAGYANINLDLMYALPEQTLGQALIDIEHAIALVPTHISHYQLTLEPNTLFAAQPPPLPNDDAAWDMQERCQALLDTAGYKQYEVSAYARKGRQCIHNVNYWTYGDYLGIGAGAHGKLTDTATHTVHRRWKIRHPRSYLDTAATTKRIGDDIPVAIAELPFEFMLNALRLNEGVCTDIFEQRTGLKLKIIETQLAQARYHGWLESDLNQLRPTELGRRFLNNLIELFLPDKN